MGWGEEKGVKGVLNFCSFCAQTLKSCFPGCILCMDNCGEIVVRTACVSSSDWCLLCAVWKTCTCFPSFWTNFTTLLCFLPFCSYPALPESSSDMQADCWEESRETSGDDFISSSEEEEEEEICSNGLDVHLPMLVLPMYSMLPVDQQAKVRWEHKFVDRRNLL